MPERSSARPGRDPRLDFFRGLAMFIIFIAHVPNNPWTLWIPARFGFSDATEIFVFCSGMASAHAFGRIFVARGWFVGTARILYRAWQIHWVHVCLFVSLATTLGMLDASGRFGDGYVNSLNLEPFFAHPLEGMAGILTLTFVPNYFDILPMYFGILLLVPLVIAAHRLSPLAALGLVGGLWLMAQAGLNLSADPWTDRTWFFNPFGWQLIFFTGFAFASGWLKAPPVDRRLIRIAVVFLVLTVPLAWFRILEAVPLASAVAAELAPLTDKSRFGLLRFLHFLALAYLAFVAAGPGGSRLVGFGRVGALIHEVGQQALATFVVGAFLARLVLVVFESLGKGPLVVLAVNLLGFGALILTARIVGWYRKDRASPGRARQEQVTASGEPGPLPTESRQSA